MTSDDLRAQLEEDRTSRADEIRRLRNLMAHMDDAGKDEFRRTLVIMTYAHFEGFCKTALQSYVLSVNALKLTSSRASPEIVAASWCKRFTRLENPNNKCEIFRRMLPDDTELHRFARRRDFVSELPDFMSTVVNVPDDIIAMEGNLTPIVLKKNLFRLGLNHSLADSMKSELNELLNRRNGICHGADRKPVSDVEYKRIADAAEVVMEEVMLTVVDGFSKRLFEVPRDEIRAANS